MKKKARDVGRPLNGAPADPGPLIRTDSNNFCGFLLTALSWLLIVLTMPVSMCLCLKVVQEYERAVIFRLGRLLQNGAKGPGLFFVIPCTDSYTKVDLRTVSFDVPPQEACLDEATEPWGVKVERVEMKDVRLPVQLQRAMAAEAEAAREARAKVIAAEGEHKAARALKDAADIIDQSHSALQLRYLQTLGQIASEKNSTIIFPMPIEFLNPLAGVQPADEATDHSSSAASALTSPTAASPAEEVSPEGND